VSSPLQVQGSVDLQGLLQGAPGDLHEGDPAGRVPSVADLVAVMRDGLAESRHDGESHGGAARGCAEAPAGAGREGAEQAPNRSQRARPAAPGAEWRGKVTRAGLLWAKVLGC